MPLLSSFLPFCCIFLFYFFEGSILDLQDDPPNLKNLDSSSDIHRFLKNQGFRYEDGLESVLGPSWAPLGCSWGSLGSTFGPPDRPKWPTCRTVVARSNGVKAFCELTLSLFVVLVALLLASCCYILFEVVFYPLLEPLGVDFELPRRPSEPQKP